MPVKKFDIIGVPSDLGCNYRGSNTAAFEFRNHNLHSMLKCIADDLRDLGNIDVPLREEIIHKNNHQTINYPYNFETIINYLVDLKKLTYNSISQSRIPLILGGDHSLSIGSIAGLDRIMLEQNKSYAVLWLDAHLDAHTPNTSPSQNMHGMSLAYLVGKLQPTISKYQKDHELNIIPSIPANNCIVMGARSIDNHEYKLLKQKGVHVFTMADIERFSLKDITTKIKQILSHIDHLHISLDIDVIDPNFAPAVSTPVPGGMSTRELNFLISEISSNCQIMSMDVVEYVPHKDQNLNTLNIALQLISSAFSGIN